MCSILMYSNDNKRKFTGHIDRNLDKTNYLHLNKSLRNHIFIYTISPSSPPQIKINIDLVFWTQNVENDFFKVMPACSRVLLGTWYTGSVALQDAVWMRKQQLPGVVEQQQD